MAEFLDALDLTDVTLVHSDWGGALFLTADGLDARVARMAILPCEAFGNFPPGLPGRVAALAARIPGGLRLGARQLRVRALRRSPLLLGQIARSELPDALVRSWTQPLLENPLIGRDVRAYARYRFDPATATWLGTSESSSWTGHPRHDRTIDASGTGHPDVPSAEDTPPVTGPRSRPPAPAADAGAYGRASSDPG